MIFSFLCPKCKIYNLLIKELVKIKPRDYNDEEYIQIVRCSCGFGGIAIYQESRHGSDTAFDHTGYLVPESKIAELEKIIANKEIINTEHFLINKNTGFYYDHFAMILTDDYKKNIIDY